MRYILIFIFSIAVMNAKAQFTGTDSLRNYNNRYITTNPATAFTNNRLNTLLRGIIDFIDTARAGGGGAIQLGIDTVFAVNDSTIRYRKNGVFRQFTLKGVYESRRKVDTIYKSNDTTLTFTVNGTPRTVIIPGGTNLNLATADQTATGNRNHNWDNKWLYLNNIKAFGIYQDQPDANHTNNRFITQFTTDSTINGYPLRMLWGLKNINDDFTDSLRFELASLKGYTYLYHQAAGGAKYATLQLNGDVFAPNVEIYTAGEGKNSYYHFGASASLEPNDSIRLKLQSASTTTKIIGARAESGGVWTPVVIDIPSSGAVLNNVGTGLRRVTTPNGSIKTDIYGYGINGDSTTNANSITVQADTSELVTPSDLANALTALSGVNMYNADSTIASNRTITQAGRYLRFQDGIDYTQFNGALQTIQPDSTAMPFYIRELKSPFTGTSASGILSWWEGLGTSAQAPERPNYPYMRGWNLAAGGGAMVSGRPAIGESWEPHYLPDPGSPTLWLQEYHKFYIQPNGTQRRLESWTINTRDNNWNVYYTTPGWSLRDTSSTDYLFASTASATDKTSTLTLKAGNAATEARLVANGSTDNFQINSISAGPLEFNNWTNILFGNSNGYDVTNNSWGVTRFGQGFDIVRSSHPWGIHYKNTAGGSDVAAFTADGNTGEVRNFVAAGGYFPTFYSNGSERARISTAGNLLVGTGTDNTIGKLQVSGKVTIATIDSTSNLPNIVYQDPNTKELKKAAAGTGSVNISNASLSANGSYTHDWNQQQLKVDTISFLHLTGTDVVSSRRQNLEIRQQANTFSLPFQAQAAVKTADGVTDSLINRFRIFGHLTELGAATSINDGAAAINATTNGEGSLPQAALGASDGTFPSNRGSSVTASPTRLRLLGNDSITIKGVEAAASGDSILSVIRTTNNEFKLRRIPYSPGSGADGNGIYGGSGSIPSGTTTVTEGNNILAFTSTQASSAATSFANTGNGNAVSISSTGSGASLVASNSGSGVGAQVSSVGGNGMNISSDNATAANFTINPSSTNTVDRVANYIRRTTGTAAANMGGSIGYQLEDDGGASYSAAQIKWIQTNPTAASRTTAFTFSVLDAGTSNDRFTISGSGQHRAHAYGAGTFSVTPATTPVYSSNGTIGERIAPKIYTALLSQSGTGAPTATVLGTNEIGTIVWTRNSTGNYTGTLSGAFTANKTWLIVQRGDQTGSFINNILSWTSANAVLLTTQDNAANPTDNFTNMSIEIRVYP